MTEGEPTKRRPKGGANNSGAVYRIVPPATIGAAQAETVLASLPAGCVSQSNLVEDGHGGLLGTAAGCGAFSKGMVFQVSPAGHAGWTLTSLHDFGGGGDGEAPVAGLIPGPNGVFYGTTSGGNLGSGTVFSIVP